MILRAKDLELLRVQSKGKRIVFVSGCFDALHQGHIAFLNRAKKEGDILVAGVLSDRYIREHKHREPFHPQHTRALLVNELKSVTHTLLTPYTSNHYPSLRVVKALRPDVFFRCERGHSYAFLRRELELLGIRLKAIPMKKINSSSILLKKVVAMAR